jgi:hypothetical protein
MPDSLPLGPAVLEQHVTFGPCYAQFSNNIFVLGNEHAEHRWKVSGGLLEVGGSRRRVSAQEWAELSQPEPPRPTMRLPESVSEVHFLASGGPFCVDEQPSLQVELKFLFAPDELGYDTNPSAVILYRFSIQPGLETVDVQMEAQSLRPTSPGFDPGI